MKSLIKIPVLSLFITLTKAKEVCWAEKFGFKCCKENHIDNVSDSDGDWAQENGDWCGLKDYQEKECWSEKFGVSCCPEYTKINYSDGDGDWHYNYATGEWCGIREPYASKCWAEKHGYECCLENHLDYVTDKYGKRWSEENGKKCGIATTQEIDYSSTAETCWTKSYKLVSFYNCCKYDYINPNDDSSGFGKWFNFKVNGRTYTVCAMKNGYPYWNDRERYDETREQWNDFKSKWGEGKEIDVNNFERLSVVPGKDESQLNFGWYSTTTDYSLIRFGTTKYLTKENEVRGTNYKCKAINGTQYYCNQVTVIGLEPNSTYYYQRNLNGNWEESIEFKTHDPYNFRFIFLGDPQIGASHNVLSIDKYIDDDESLRNDAFNWNMTIYNSYSKANEASLILSAGDNTDSGQSPSDRDILRYPDELEYDLIKQEKEYSSLLLPELMQKVPFASAVGNHESFTASFRYHFNTPNSLEVESNNQIPGYDYASVTPGYSYFFKYNNVLIIVLESNYGTEEQYETLLEKACSTYPGVDWRIALFHHDIYSNGFNHSEEERVLLLRQWLTKLLYKNKIDLVINGHDHIYSASHFISYDINNSNQYKYNITEIERNKIYKDHKGTMYITANSSTGSKLYKTKDYDMGYLYFYNQTYSSTFGILDFKNENGKVQMKITSYEVDTYNITDGPYIFEKDANEISFNTTTTTTTTTTTAKKSMTTTINIISTPESCWSLPDYPCCRNKKTDVVYTDDNGNWGIENENWCGIIRESEENTCWSLPDYSCCKDKNIDVIYTDNMGNWGIENGEWCGIIRESMMEEICWSLPDYPCCNNNNIAVVITDDKGNWGIENGEWCGILKE